jgi:hypothetical protein
MALGCARVAGNDVLEPRGRRLPVLQRRTENVGAAFRQLPADKGFRHSPKFFESLLHTNSLRKSMSFTPGRSVILVRAQVSIDSSTMSYSSLSCAKCWCAIWRAALAA